MEVEGTTEGRSQFFTEADADVSVYNRSLTGTTISQIGHSHFFSKPSVAQLNASPPNIISKNMAIRPSYDCIRFPQMKEFSHFHYDTQELSSLQASLDPSNEDDDLYSITVKCNQRSWIVHRRFDDFKVLDSQLHYCVFDRQLTKLVNLQELNLTSIEAMNKVVEKYLVGFSGLDASFLYCGTVLNFFEVDNRGHHLIVTDHSAINIPAIAAAQVIKCHASQAADELSLEVGDMVSVIDKPLAEESTWWRGKKGFEVGFFPSECVEIIGVKVPHKASTPEDTKPVLRRRGKLITFLRMFFSNRPNRNTLKQSGIVRERVYGCDLGEHLLNSGLAVPHIVKCCTNAIEEHGLIDGIYRLTGVASTIQKLRAEFDEGTIVSLNDEEHLLDLHTITAVLKMYFRDLPNPLLTYQLYDSFAAAVQFKGEERLEQLKDTVEKLPPPHYRCAKVLFAHLHKLSQISNKTGMDSRNLAIVWSPNLMRSKAVESGGVTGATMLTHVSIQATVTEAIISNYQYIFGASDCVRLTDEHFEEEATESTALSDDDDEDVNKKPRPSSVAVSTPSRLLTLSEAQDRLSSESGQSEGRNALSCGGEPDVIPVFHTVIDFNDDRKKSARVNQSGLTRDKHSVWKSIFSRGRSSSVQSSKKKRTKSIDGGEAITDNDIAHLSRKLQSISTNTGSLPSIPNTSECLPLHENQQEIFDDLEPPGSAGLTRCASHESFFESPLSAGLTSGQPKSHESLFSDASAAESAGRTPGVIFRPAYKREALEEILNKPQAQWKQRTTNPSSASFRTSHSASSSSRTLSSLPANCMNKVGRSSLDESPGVRRKTKTLSLNTGDQASSASLVDNTQPSVTSVTSPLHERQTTEQDMGELIASWEDSDNQMMLNQAQQARLSRSYSHRTEDRIQLDSDTTIHGSLIKYTQPLNTPSEQHNHSHKDSAVSSNVHRDSAMSLNVSRDNAMSSEVSGETYEHTYENGDIVGRFASMGSDDLQMDGELVVNTQNVVPELYPERSSGSAIQNILTPPMEVTPKTDFTSNLKRSEEKPLPQTRAKVRRSPYYVNVDLNHRGSHSKIITDIDERLASHSSTFPHDYDNVAALHENNNRLTGLESPSSLNEEQQSCVASLDSIEEGHLASTVTDTNVHTSLHLLHTYENVLPLNIKVSPTSSVTSSYEEALHTSTAVLSNVSTCADNSRPVPKSRKQRSSPIVAKKPSARSPVSRSEEKAFTNPTGRDDYVKENSSIRENTCDTFERIVKPAILPKPRSIKRTNDLDSSSSDYSDTSLPCANTHSPPRHIKPKPYPRRKITDTCNERNNTIP